MINKLLSQISELLHGEFSSFWLSEINKTKNATWLKLFASRDLMRDTVEALDVDENSNANILSIYGFMSALYLQQNALQDMYECIKNEKLDFKNYTAISKARSLRNDEIGGHPIHHGKDINDEKRRYNVLAPHLTQGWLITISNHAKQLTERVIVVHDLLEIRDNQDQEVVEILTELLAFLQNKLKVHKENFMQTKLIDLFKGLCLSRIMQAILDPSRNNLHLAKTECSSLKTQTMKFLELIAERGENTDISKTEIEEFTFGLERILNYALGSEEDKLHASLLWRGLNSIFSNLKNYAQEIDARYSS